MRFKGKCVAVAALLCVCTTAVAAPIGVYPVQTGEETVRFRQGIPVLDLELPEGAVQVTPLPMDHGSLAFSIAVYNKGTGATNFGSENVSAVVGPQTLASFTKDQLVSQAKSRAMWSAIGVAMLAGAAAAAASQAHTTNTYRSYTSTPWGGVSHVASWRDNSIGVLGAGASVAAGAVAINGIQNRLDYTVANLNDEILQTTTVDGDASYAGRVVLEKIKNKKLPQDVTLKVSFNGVVYPFTFRVTKAGTNMPAPYSAKALASAPFKPSDAEAAPVAAPASPAQPAVTPVAVVTPTTQG